MDLIPIRYCPKELSPDAPMKRPDGLIFVAALVIPLGRLKVESFAFILADTLTLTFNIRQMLQPFLGLCMPYSLLLR